MRAIVAAMTLLLAGCATVPHDVAPFATAGIAFDRNGEIASFAEGLADPQTRRLVTPDDPARVASVSKLVVGIGVMKLVEQGKVDLDSDVSRWLGWSIRNPAFPDRPISLRMLLSHTGSVRDHDDQYAIPLGSTVRETMADPRSWDVHHGPNDAYFAYSNMNFPIIASVIERATGERFDIWMRREVLEPMKLDACYNWATCSNSAIARAVELDGPDGKPLKDDLHGIRPACPVYINEGDACDFTRSPLGENGALFGPQGGLRISVRGLARVGRLLLNGGTLDGVRILSPQSVETLLTPAWKYDGKNGSRAEESATVCSYGLTTQQIPTPGCADNPGTDGALLVGHAGDAYGLRSGLWIDRKRGRGIAYFVTGVPDDPAEASVFSTAETKAFRRAYALLPR
jgi:CubicO group peptidase (beta-lactamase class C family)